MSRLLMVLAATAAVAFSGTAQAQTRFSVRIGGGYSQDDSWNNGGDTYSEFQEEYEHILQGIRHGLGDGSFSRYEASQFYRELQSIRASAYYAQRGWDDRGDYIQARLERLHERMHNAHERRHDDDENSDWNGGSGGYNPYRR